MKKGFTLIELLAVIVILAILALIVSPIISNVIKEARIASAARSLELYATAIENAQYEYMFAHGGAITTTVADLQSGAEKCHQTP